MGEYIVNHSNYTIKKRHKSLPDSTIYERDFMSTTNLGGWDSGVLPNENGNFKFVYRTDLNHKRKRKYGDYLVPENGEAWVEGNLPKTFASAVTSETKIVLKPNFNSLLDFAYYGSCTELIKSSIKHIIETFPGELYITNSEYKNGNKTYYLVENPFEIDILTKVYPFTNENQLRYFCASSNKYIVYNQDGKIYSCIDKWEPVKYEGRCISDDWDEFGHAVLFDKSPRGKCVIYKFFLGGRPVYMCDNPKYCGYHIRLIEDEIEKYFNRLEDAERLLLNRDTEPIYTALLDNPHETEHGIDTYKKAFSWPVSHEWNLDIASTSYNNYINSLLNLCEFYDENYTNNIWRMLTHDSIKNMDIDFASPLHPNNDKEDYTAGSGRIEGLMWTFGRQFDELKKAIDNIKSSGNVSYDGNNNVPDYFLSDNLELQGWEVSSSVGTLEQDVYSPSLFIGQKKKYNASDANICFLRNLKLASKDILSRKGTRAGVEAILGLFGLVSYDYAKNQYPYLPPELQEKDNSGNTISWDELTDGQKQKRYDYTLSEYVNVATPKPILNSTMDDGTLWIEHYNMQKGNYPTESGSDGISTVLGLPVKVVELINGENTKMKYIIPWFSNLERYDGDMYFQMYGGWGKMYKKTIANGREIVSDENFTVYDETQSYLNIVNTVEELIRYPYVQLSDGDIFYVYDMTGYDNDSGATNYFILVNKDNSNIIGETGWKNISQYDIDTFTTDGVKVLYLESIIDEHKGNNPHIGKGKYDNGETYLDYFRTLFKDAIEKKNFREESDAFDCSTGELIQDIKDFGFTLEKQEDNVKCWYFIDNYSTNEILHLQEKMKDAVDMANYNDYKIPCGYEEIEKEPVTVGSESTGMFYKTALIPKNYEISGYTNDEAAANSIINVKNLKIEFSGTESMEPDFKNYLYKTIMPYLKQMIPSTTILEVKTVTDDINFACIKTPKIIGFANIDKE